MTTLVEWMLNHARADFERGRAVPDNLAAGIRKLLDTERSFANESTPATPATVEVGVTEMALHMGCSEQWVRRLCRTGRLPARRIGRRDWLITTQEHHGEDDPGAATDIR